MENQKNRCILFHGGVYKAVCVLKRISKRTHEGFIGLICLFLRFRVKFRRCV